MTSRVSRLVSFDAETDLKPIIIIINIFAVRSPLTLVPRTHAVWHVGDPSSVGAADGLEPPLPSPPRGGGGEPLGAQTGRVDGRADEGARRVHLLEEQRGAEHR